MDWEHVRSVVRVDGVQLQRNRAVAVNLGNGQGLAAAAVAPADHGMERHIQGFVGSADSVGCNDPDARKCHRRVEVRKAQLAYPLERHQQVHRFGLRTQKQLAHQTVQSAAQPEFVPRSNWQCGQRLLRPTQPKSAPWKEVACFLTHLDVPLTLLGFPESEHRTCR